MTSSSVSRDDLIRGSRRGPYEVTVLIGAGAMGEVLAGADTSLRPTVFYTVRISHAAATTARMMMSASSMSTTRPLLSFTYQRRMAAVPRHFFLISFVDSRYVT